MNEIDLCQRIIEKCRKQQWYGPDADVSSWIAREREKGIRLEEIDLQQIPLTYTFANDPVTEEQIQNAERTLGFALHPVLRAIYTQVADGDFGPGYGLYRLEDLVGSYRLHAEHERLVDFHFFEEQSTHKDLVLMPTDAWPDGLLCLCHWGCGMFSHFEVATGRVFQYAFWEGDQNGFQLEAPTLESWFEQWLSQEVDVEPEPRHTIGIIRLEK